MLTVLDQSHLDLFVELKKNNPGQWKFGENFDNDYDPKDFYSTVLMHKQAYTVGYIENGELISIGSLFEDQSSPSWTLIYYANKKTNYHISKNMKSHLIYSALFQEGFRRKLSSCVIFSRADLPVVYTTASDKMKKRLEDNYYKFIPEIKMFDWVDEYNIPANTMPKYKYMQDMMRHKTWPADLIVRRGYLKQEHRKELVFT
jgi:hypothetical protein